MRRAAVVAVALLMIGSLDCARQGVQAQAIKPGLELQPLQLSRTDQWNMFGGSGDIPGAPVAKASPGHELVVVQFEVRDAATHKVDTSTGLAGFSAEDAAGAKYPSMVERTDLREIAFDVPQGTKLARFTVEGTTFDIAQLQEKK